MEQKYQAVYAKLRTNVGKYSAAKELFEKFKVMPENVEAMAFINKHGLARKKLYAKDWFAIQKVIDDEKPKVDYEARAQEWENLYKARKAAWLVDKGVLEKERDTWKTKCQDAWQKLAVEKEKTKTSPRRSSKTPARGARQRGSSKRSRGRTGRGDAGPDLAGAGRVISESGEPEGREA